MTDERETKRVELRLQRSALHTLDLDDIDAVRERVRQIVTDRIAGTVAVPGEMLFYSDPHLERLALDGVVELGEESVLASLFLDMHLHRPELRHRFRIGEVIQGSTEGRGRRAAVMLELTDVATRAWRLERALFGQVEHGPGRILGGWEVEEGEGLDALPAELHEWLDTEEVAGTEFTSEDLRPPDLSGVDLRMVVLDENLPPEWTDDDTVLVEQLAVGIEREILSEGLDAAVVLVGRTEPQRLERWELRGDPGTLLEDLLAHIGQLGGAGAFLSFTYGGVLAMDDTSVPALITLLERDEMITTRIRGYRVHEGELQVRSPILQPTRESKRPWLTTPPNPDLDMTILGLVGGPPPADA